MDEWKIKKITKNNMNHWGCYTSIMTFDHNGNLLRDINREGKRKEINYSRKNFLFWNYERKEDYDEDNYRECYIKIRNRKGKKLLGLGFNDSKLCGFTVYDKNEKEKIDWDNSFGNIFLTICKKGKSKYEYEKWIYADNESNTYYNHICHIFYNSLGYKTAVVEKDKYRKTKTVYIYKPENQTVREIYTDLKTHKIIEETVSSYKENLDKNESDDCSSCSYVDESKLVFRDINGIKYMTCPKDKDFIVKNNSYGMPVEIIETSIPGDTGKASKIFIEYEYFE